MTDPVLPPSAPGPVTRWSVAGRPRRDGRPVRLFGASVGDPSAPAVVIAHGAGSSARFVVAAFADAVVGAGWRLVTYDLRGHGSSDPCPDPADHLLPVQVDDLDVVVDAVRATDAGDLAAVGGISLGGHAAMRWAVEHAAEVPVLACLPAWLGRATPGAGPHAVVAEEVRRIGIGAITDRLRADASLVPWLRETLVTDYARHDAASLTAALLALDGGQAPDVAELAQLRAPLGLVAWPDDPGHPIAVARAIADAVPRAALVELELTHLEGDLGRFGRAALDAVTAARGADG